MGGTEQLWVDLDQYISANGSNPEKLNASKCFPLFSQQRTSRAKALWPIACLVASDPRSGFSILKKLKILRMNQDHRSAPLIVPAI
jgi:hypothetical protein